MVSSEIRDGVLHVKVLNALTVDIFNEFETAYSKKKFDHIVIDFSHCNHIDSGGLGMLLQLRNRMGDDRNKITLKNLSDEILSIFEVVKFEKLFTLV